MTEIKVKIWVLYLDPVLPYDTSYTTFVMNLECVGEIATHLSCLAKNATTLISYLSLSLNLVIKVKNAILTGYNR